MSLGGSYGNLFTPLRVAWRGAGLFSWPNELLSNPAKLCATSASIKASI